MPLLYESYMAKPLKPKFPRLFQITHREYPLGFPDELGEGTHTKTVEITWDEKYTSIVEATLHVTGNLTVGNATPLIPVRGGVSFIVNGSIDGEVLGDVAVLGALTKSFSIDYPIKTWIQKGKNEVMIAVRKSAGWPTWVSLSALTCNIGIDFEGQPPAVKVPTPEWWAYAKWGLIGIGGIVFIGVVVPKIVEIARKPKG